LKRLPVNAGSLFFWPRRFGVAMRAFPFVTVALLALSGCGNSGQADNMQSTDERLSAENIAANDVTAIDAVTGDAANMAADVNYADFGNDLAGGDSNGSAVASKRPSASPTRPKPRQPDEPASAPPPIANTIANNSQ
jgi:hypothetical protein